MTDLSTIYRKNLFTFGDTTFTIEDKIPIFQAPWGIVTAWNPNNRHLPPAMNALRNKRLLSLLKRSGYQIEQGKGGLGKHFEESFLIHAISLRNMLKIGRRFDQYSIYWCDGNQSGYYLCSTGKVILIH